MNIRLLRISSIADPQAVVFVANDLRQVQKVCEMLGTEDTVWSSAQIIDELGGRAAKGEFDLHIDHTSVTISPKSPAGEPSLRQGEVGGLSSAYYDTPNGPEFNAPPTGKLTLQKFARLTAGLSPDTTITFHGYDKGCGLHAYSVPDLWLFPKDDKDKRLVVLNPGPTYDGRASDREDSSDREVVGIFVVCEIIAQKPCVSVHPTELAARKHAVECATENLLNPGDDEKLTRAEIEVMLTDYGRITEGDYEVHILTPTN